MGWFRAMGAETVAYHKETVVGRGDDHPGRALDYYGSRGETPLRWGGAVAARLGLTGEVTPEQYELAFGPGGFRDPLTGDRLVTTKTPGVEIVVAAHKTTAMLGLVGRADDMHAILDAETDGLMGALEASMQANGGRRGRSATPTPTTGLAWAVTRHGTSRAGDPAPHDHVLIVNLTEMLDTKGGYKALYTALLRDRVEAATMIGRLQSAYLAVKLGYAIEHDNGPSGRLRHWRIAGIPADICDTLSKRSDEIAAYLAEQGYTSYQAANIAARATRSVKRHTGVDELLERWHAEIAEAGWPVGRIAVALDAASQHATGVSAPFMPEEVEEITAGLMDPEGQFLARGKVFSRSRLIAEVAPMLYGHDPAELDGVLDHILASGLVTPLIGVASAVEQPYTATAILTTEHTIADTVERLVTAPGPTLDPAAVRAAIAAKETEIGAALAAGQYQAINAVCCSGRAVDVIVGIAGSGKTTALDAAATALEAAGYRVIGTATSGQAARTLGQAAGIEARTTRSLLWQLDHGGIVLDGRSVVVLDEAGMTTDIDMARLVLAVEAAGAKVVIVGDDRQLSAVGPGGALHQVLADHPHVVTTLTENRRQHDPAERDALLELRAGDLDTALDFYADNHRITIGPLRTPVLHNLVEQWAADTAAGHDTFMLAWRRQSVADLNRIARAVARDRGWLTGDEIVTPGGRAYATGDVVVTLAPNYRGQLVTSERATITAIDPMNKAITIRTHNGRAVTLVGEELDRDRLDHGYALTIHREQGATSDRTHYLAEGGGRELAYVALSRARHHTTIHTVADNLHQALDHIRTDWTHTNHDTWITPTTTIGTDPRHQPAPIQREDVRGRITAELDRLHALTPPDVTADLIAARDRADDLDAQRRHLDAGTGAYAQGPVGQYTRELQDADADRYRTRLALATARPWQRPALRRQAEALDNQRATATAELDRHTTPEARRLDNATTVANRRIAELRTHQQFNRRWRRDHPEHTTRIRQLQRLLAGLDRPTKPSPVRDQAAAELLDALPGPDTTSIHDHLNADILAALDDLDAACDHVTQPEHPDPIPEQDRSRGHGIEL